MKILIIDDDIPTTEVIRDTVNWNMLQIDKIDIAHNVISAKKLITAFVPDIILCDIEMPQGNGIELLQWLREQGYHSQFVFLTCHESFSYATTAIQFSALDYIIKPFQLKQVEAVLAKAVEKIVRENNTKNDLRFKDYWLNNQSSMEESFWRDLLFYALRADNEYLLAECEKRHVKLDLHDTYRLALCAVPRRQIVQNDWSESAFRYALRNLSSELLLFNFDNARCLIYGRNESLYVLVVLQNIKEITVQERCINLINAAEKHLNCTVKCHISESCGIVNLPDLRSLLEQSNRENVTEGGGFYMLRDAANRPSELIDINIGQASHLLNEGKVIDAINHIRSKLQAISSRNQLSHTALNNILQDYNQMMYVKLQSHDIQVHELFGDSSSVKLRQSAEFSLFDAMKWISYSANKTVEYIHEVQQLESVVAKIKRYVFEHICQPVSRAEIAASVFLTPDYVSKIFKSETGINLKDYVNETRIEKAKELLSTTSQSVSEIAVAVGFDNFSYFSTLFKKITGVSPSSYNRKK